MKTTRQPIVTVLGHIDSGKTTLLDYIRGTLVAERESGGITQSIKATAIPDKVVENLCGGLLAQFGTTLKIPGLLFIDTPGHSAFSSLRARGSSLSDIAILIVDINQGVQDQTREAIRALRDNEVPFVIALNKIDSFPGWQSGEECFINNLKHQSESVKERLRSIIYDLMSDFSDFQLDVERFDRVDDFRKKVAIIPISAKTGEGVPDLLATIAGLSQKYIADRLEVEEGIGKASVLEVSESKGFGTTIDVILYDGTIADENWLVIGGKDQPLVTEIKTMLRPEKPGSNDFEAIKQAGPAAALRIAAQDLEEVAPGAPLLAVNREEIEEHKAAIQSEMRKLKFKTGEEGVVVRSDSLGSLEAVLDILKGKKVPVKSCEVGKVKKKDVVEVISSASSKALLAFNTQPTEAAQKLIDEENVKLFQSNVIYKLVEDYQDWQQELKEKRRQERLEGIKRPAEIRILPEHTFRSFGPLIVGIEVRKGTLTTGCNLMNLQGEHIGTIASIQKDKESIDEASKGDKVAISVKGPKMGRQVEENEALYTDLCSEDYKTLKDLEEMLPAHETDVLETIVEIKDKINPRWKLS